MCLYPRAMIHLDQNRPIQHYLVADTVPHQSTTQVLTSLLLVKTVQELEVSQIPHPLQPKVAINRNKT